MCFVDIAYDEIPERYYKESEVGPCVALCTDALGAANVVTVQKICRLINLKMHWFLHQLFIVCVKYAMYMS